AGSHATLSGKVSRVPWGRHADAVVLLARDPAGAWTTVVVRGAAVAEKGANFANEPRDTFVLDGLRVPIADVGKPGESLDPAGLRFIGARFRAAQMAGALSRVLALSVQYAKERIQFGKPIGQFQAVQQQLAVLASQSAAANAAFDALTSALDSGPADFETAAAKARIGEAGHVGAGIGHAVHAAMGFTQEHSLHRFTRRIWSWRDEFGSEIDWAEWLGAEVLAAGGDGLWPLILGERP
ncbi:MAG TPA: acyl-CoA dehydrogenase family protein, partial [Novosphingobium sp.]|nr:acyl-CoA dehydrogenase family protein [Novosphingobium sp.]